MVKSDSKLSLYQKNLLWKSLSELQPYIEDYSVEFHECPKTKFRLIHADIIIQFKKDIPIDLPAFSEDFKAMWGTKFDTLQSFLDHPSSLRKCIRTLPKSIVDSCFSNPHEYHHDGSWNCYY